MQDFVEKLKVHLLPRVIERLGQDKVNFHEDDWLNLSFTDHRLYAHRLLHVNYTTYDVRRTQDIIHINTPQCNVMLLDRAFTKKPSCDSIHPFLYAKALGIYHVNIAYVGVLPDGTRDFASHRFDVVWVHWYDYLKSETEFALDRLSFQPLTSDTAVGFVDPADILRGVHLIPQFAGGPSEHPAPTSEHVPAQEVWSAYYINK